MSDSLSQLPDWEKLLAAERHLQLLLPSAVLVGGTAVALHAHHRLSMDGDHVLADLRPRFDQVVAQLESVAGWQTEKLQSPVLILGKLDGVMTGIRQLRRIKPLEVEVIDGLRVPTLAEMSRIKGWLLLTRYTVRDYLDTCVLLERLGKNIPEAFLGFDEIYPQSNLASPLSEVIERLKEGMPIDATKIVLENYKGLGPPWNNWSYLLARGRHWATVLAKVALEQP